MKETETDNGGGGARRSPRTTRTRSPLSVALVVCVTCAAGLASPQNRSESETPNPVSGRDPTDASQITPADVLARVQLIAIEINEIRRIMGKPVTAGQTLGIKNAQPREVLFQARTMFRKANRFAFENSRTTHDLAAITTDEIKPIHVWQAVDASLRRILEVKQRFGITTKFNEVRAPETTVPSDVIAALFKTNRQLNSLLREEFAPANVYQQLTRAVHLASRSMEPFGQSVATIAVPPFEEAKTPADVYACLLVCFEHIRRIGAMAGVSVLSIELPERGIGEVTPGDVYGIASLLVAELTYLHSRIPGVRPPEPAYYPGLKFPSHVFQRAELLRRQLEAIEDGMTKSIASE